MLDDDFIIVSDNNIHALEMCDIKQIRNTSPSSLTNYRIGQIGGTNAIFRFQVRKTVTAAHGIGF